MEYSEMLIQFNLGRWGVGKVLEEMANKGLCPNLLFDDNGHWGISFEGFQNASSGDEAETLVTTCLLEPEDLKDSIDEAIVHTLNKLIQE